MQLQSIGVQTQNNSKQQNFGKLVLANDDTVKAVSKLASDGANTKINTILDALGIVDKAVPNNDVFLKVADNGDFRFNFTNDDKDFGFHLFSPKLPLTCYSKQVQEEFKGKTKFEQFITSCLKLIPDKIKKIDAEKAEAKRLEAKNATMLRQQKEAEQLRKQSRDAASDAINHMYGVKAERVVTP